MNKPFTFDQIYQQNKRRIHYQSHRLNIHDPHQEFFQEGLTAMWHAYEKYEPDKGPMATYFNYTIRHRLLDELRKQKREQDKQHTLPIHPQQEPHTSHQTAALTDLLLDNHQLCNKLKSYLTEKQWKWLKYAILLDMPYKDIAIQENTTTEAVKSWGRQARKKLFTPAIYQLLKEI
ncbi:sigma-70 family RNA polymerase sigma factor [Virgibacillus halodenitrificans]|uniref:sigma-70 family RNA polymerase sigma factor n=1 Tax=Virgibacillus halodenitrificans TaxID=1482 RepID=UPI0013711882|nr:sigma-70 family RNA polymerase sigma factor [Virgibacillus halodenitrificans]MYL47143.1 sigma-70 family RNA polymerase sigma factor [Virgibacillus halodenitrificans]